jgi:hypothetical protein
VFFYEFFIVKNGKKIPKNIESKIEATSIQKLAEFEISFERCQSKKSTQKIFSKKSPSKIASLTTSEKYLNTK